jgi:hypothetical protein
MPLDHHREDPTAIRTSLGAIFVSLEPFGAIRAKARFANKPKPFHGR